MYGFALNISEAWLNMMSGKLSKRRNLKPSVKKQRNQSLDELIDDLNNGIYDGD